jgi:hypothetical protein
MNKKILISHRGNIDGPNPIRENSPNYVMEAIAMGYEVEIDVWWIDGRIYLGHDEPQYEISGEWLQDRIDKLWVHCKNVELLNWIRSTSLHYFWHENDTVSLTSKNYIWAYPGKQPIIGSISVMPEINNDDTHSCFGICSDFIKNFK